MKITEILKLIRDMVFSEKFLIAVFMMLIMYGMGKIDLMVAAVVAYLAIKTAINTSITMKEGEFEYQFVSNVKLNSIICWFISTKTWISVAAFALILKAASLAIVMPEFLKFQLIETCPVGEVCKSIITYDQASLYVIELGAALGAAIGIPEIAGFLKGADFAQFKPKPAQTINIQNLNAQPNQPVVAQPAAQPQIPTTPSLAPEYVAFNNDDWDKKVSAKARELFLEITPTTLYRTVWNIAQVTRCWYVNNLISFGYYYQSKAEDLFGAHFGFSYADRNKPDCLATLRDQCGKIPVSFEQYVAQDPLNSSVIVDELVKIIDNNDWVLKLAGKRSEIEFKLQTAPVSGYNFNDAYWNAKELYQNS